MSLPTTPQKNGSTSSLIGIALMIFGIAVGYGELRSTTANNGARIEELEKQRITAAQTEQAFREAVIRDLADIKAAIKQRNP